MRNMKASDHVMVAQRMLDLLGDPEKVCQETSHASRNLALAEAVRAHLKMARFKMDFPDVFRLAVGKAETEAAINEDMKKG